MTREPPSMLGVKDQIIKRWGRQYYLGINGDDSHFYGYHLGPKDVAPEDMSVLSVRDMNGSRLGNYASAIDVGMGFKDSRKWLSWVVREAERGTFPDLVQIIGSLDGRQDYIFEAEKSFRFPTLWYGDHVRHTHLSFFRDSVFRNQAAIITGWKPAVKKPTPTPRLTPVRPSTGIVEASKRDIWDDALLPLTVVGAGVAWVIKRRREAGL